MPDGSRGSSFCIGCEHRVRTASQHRLALAPQALSEAGWEPELFVLVLGTLGEIPATAVSTLTDFGIRGVELQSLLRNLHMNALSWMDKCIDEEIELNKWNTYFAYHMRKRKRWR